MSFITDQLNILTRQLYPVGEAFGLSPDSVLDRMHQVLNDVKGAGYEAALSILDSILPDNDSFFADDATQWERRLGIVRAAGVSLADRKAAILQKMRYPGDVRPRCARSYLEAQLQLSGFNVFVYENRFHEGSPLEWITKSPSEILGIPAGLAMLGAFELDEVELDETWADAGITLVVNHIDAASDATFAIIPPYGYRSTFFIAGAVITDFADVPAEREMEFRQLILNLKPAQSVGILFINYV